MFRTCAMGGRRFALAGAAAVALTFAASMGAASGAQGGLGAASQQRAAAHTPLPNPVAANEFFEAQRRGFGHGNPVRAARLAARAEVVARSLRGRPLPEAHLALRAGPNLGAAWRPLGPAPITESVYGTTNSGRVDSVAVVQSGPNAGEIFIGTAGGGIWSSTNDGASWVTHTDSVSTGLAIGALTIDPADPSVIYAGTGEANNCADCFYGGGVLKSEDGGETWSVENPGEVFTGVHFSAIAVDPKSPNTIYATTTAGFFVSRDGGASWAHPTGAGNFTNASTGMALDPTSAQTTVYIATTEVGIQKSTNGGESFATLAGGLPAAGEISTTALGIGTQTAAHETANEYLYAAIALAGGGLAMYKTTDAGTIWTKLTETPAYTTALYAYGEAGGDQSTYDNALAVDPGNPEHVIAGGIAAIETRDGGAEWTNINGGAFNKVLTGNIIHPDFHAVAFATATGHEVTAGEALIGCDGGIYQYNPSANGGLGGPAGVASLNKAGSHLDTAQFYEGLSVYEDGARILGGLQDNGTAYLAAPGAEAWRDAVAGDGGYSAVNPNAPEQQFAEADQHLTETTNGWATQTELPIGPANEGMNGNFTSPLTIVPNAREHEEPSVFYGGADLWVTRDPAAAKPSWTKITNVRADVSAIAVAPSNPEVMYVGFDGGELYVTTDAGAATPSFTQLGNGVPQWITHIAVSPTEPGSIALSYSSSNVQSSAVPPMVQTASVALTATPSATFTNITGNLPKGVASNSVVFDQGALIVATDVGVFATAAPNAEATTWAAVGSGLPNVQVVGLTVDAGGALYAATHGRGVWKLLVTSAPPKNTGAPSISGTARVGETLTAEDGTWEGNPTAFTYKWLLCNEAGAGCAEVSGATGQTFALTEGAAGHRVEVEVTAESAGGRTTAESPPSAIVQPATTTTTSTSTSTAPTAGAKGASTTTTTTTTSTSSTPPPSTAGTATTGARAKALKGRAEVSLSCAGGPCSGRVLLRVTIVKRVRKGHRVLRRKRIVTIGSASFSLAAGAHETVAVRLDALGARLLRQAGRRGLRAQVGGTGVKAGRILLEPPRTRRTKRGAHRRSAKTRRHAVALPAGVNSIRISRY
ncbi:MAG: hypothetical protein ACYCU0_04210 [Solirubrobacteraceae bacterium]